MDEYYIRRCLTLAKRGRGNVQPNPMVGCVIIKNDSILAEGYHKRFGDIHAEVTALRKAGDQAAGATLYVNLEPCNHAGKTQPCTREIIRSKIKRVVFGMHDPNPDVNGRGAEYLQSTGIEITGPVLEDQCTKLNEVFVKNVTTHLPFVGLKIAQTLDGFIAPLSGNSKWITSVKSREYVRKLRSQYESILIGANTLRKDDPRLQSLHSKKNITRIVLTKNWKLNLQSCVLTDEGRYSTIVVSTASAIEKHRKMYHAVIHQGVHVLSLRPTTRGDISLKALLKVLYENGITSLLVEGGAVTFSRFLQERIVDKVYVFVAPKVLGKGLSSFASTGPFELQGAASFRLESVKHLSDDLLLTYYPLRRA